MTGTPPHLLLVESTDADVREFTEVIKRIGLVNGVRAVTTSAIAKDHLGSLAASALPLLVVSASAAVADGPLTDLFDWMEQQQSPISDLPILRLNKPLEMYAVIGALKALAFPERTRIDTTTLTIRVELWPHGTAIDGS